MKKLCHFTLLAGLALALPAQAVYLNPRGTGQVLLFPYYTANAGQSTLIRIDNTSDRAKVLSVRLREGYNAREVLDFYLVLGPHDSWSGNIGSLGDKQPARLLTRDSSCTRPDKPLWTSVPGGGWSRDATHFAYTAAGGDSAPSPLARTREGYIEVMERAQLTGSLTTAATAPTRRCDVFDEFLGNSPEIEAPGGGLAGHFAVVDAAQGTYLGGQATALADFSQIPLLHDSTYYVSLRNANNEPGLTYADLGYRGGACRLRYSAVAPNNSIDAVSAVLTADTVSASVVAAASGFTEWVVALPTKYHYTDNEEVGVSLGDPGAIEPFEQTFGEVHRGASCSRFGASAYDTEGQPVSFDPPATNLPALSLCRAVNVLNFGPLAPNAATPILRSRLGSSVWNPQPAFDQGRVTLDFSAGNNGAPHLLRPSLDGVSVRGLPLIGFAAYRYTNDNVRSGELARLSLLPLNATTTVCTNAQGGVIACP